VGRVELAEAVDQMLDAVIVATPRRPRGVHTIEASTSRFALSAQAFDEPSVSHRELLGARAVPRVVAVPHAKDAFVDRQVREQDLRPIEAGEPLAQLILSGAVDRGSGDLQATVPDQELPEEVLVERSIGGRTDADRDHVRPGDRAQCRHV
jgi:hypothetical protein